MADSGGSAQHGIDCLQPRHKKVLAGEEEVPWRPQLAGPQLFSESLWVCVPMAVRSVSGSRAPPLRLHEGQASALGEGCWQERMCTHVQGASTVPKESQQEGSSRSPSPQSQTPREVGLTPGR